MSEPREEEGTLIRPSEDLRKKEVLIVSAIQMNERKKHLKVYEIFRDQNEQVTRMEEFIPETPEETAVEVPLLDAFVQGFRIGFQTKYN